MKYRMIASASAAVLIASLASGSTAQAREDVEIVGDPLLITSGDPWDPAYANAGENLRTGVGSIYIQFFGIPQGGFLCTAAAIDRNHILTAAHCVINEGDRVSRIRFIPTGVTDPSGFIDAVGFSVPDLYRAYHPFLDAFTPGDIAVIELAEDLPEGVEIYGLYRDYDEADHAVRHYGYGVSGRGNRGAVGEAGFFYARTGLNRYEDDFSPFWGGEPLFTGQLVYDYDSGGRKHNAMDWWFSGYRCGVANDNPAWAQDGQCTTFASGIYPDFKGYGKLEVGLAPGDSGGPGFIGDEIAGVHSFGFTHGCAGVTNGTDFSCGLDSSYGEMNGDTRVSVWAPWVDAVLEYGTDVPVPELVVSPGGSAEAAALSASDALFLGVTVSAPMRARVE